MIKIDSFLFATLADITRIPADAIVNAANCQLSGGGGVDGAIHRAAGPELIQACRKIGGCKTGDAVITPGFNLPAKWVIHAVGPVWQGGQWGEADLLASSYRRSFHLAMQYDCRHICFSAISTGVYRYPIDLAAEIAVGTLKACISGTNFTGEIWLTAFNQPVLSAYEKIAQ